MKTAAIATALCCLFLSFVSSVFASVTINEFVAHTSSEWIELYNASDSAEYIKSYYVDDDTDFSSDAGSSGKKSLSGLNTSNNTFPYFELSNSIFNNSEDIVVLFDNLGNVIDQFQYQSDPGEDVSIGRSPDNSGVFTKLSSATKGSPNSAPPTNTPTSVPTATAVPTAIQTKTPTPTQGISPIYTPIPTKITEHINNSKMIESPIGTESAEVFAATSSYVLGSSITSDIEATKSGEKKYTIIIIPMLLISTGLALISGVLIWNKRHKHDILPP